MNNMTYQQPHMTVAKPIIHNAVYTSSETKALVQIINTNKIFLF